MESPGSRSCGTRWNSTKTCSRPKARILSFSTTTSRSVPQRRSRSMASYLSREFARATVDFTPSPVHEELAQMDIDAVYTTNYDDLLERAFAIAGRAVLPVITYSDLATRPPVGTVQIVKYHGDFAVPETLVLTESQYFERMTLDTAMDIRLRADALSRSLLFVGYSLSDVNVRYLLFRLNKERSANICGCWHWRSRTQVLHRLVFDRRGAKGSLALSL